VGTGFTAVVSLIATCAVVLMLPAATVLGSNAPIADFIAVSWGGAAGIAVAACAVVSCFGCLNGWLLVGGELPASMADAATLPRWFGLRNAAGAPASSIVLCSVMTSLLTLMALTRVGAGAYQFAALLSAATGLGVYVLSAAAIFRCMREGRIPRRAALGASAVGALLFSLWALYGTGWESLAWGATLIAAGWPLHLIARRAARSPQQ
jgi:basic amino acid/polyamine antiporter, APA family